MLFVEIINSIYYLLCSDIQAVHVFSILFFPLFTCVDPVKCYVEQMRSLVVTVQAFSLHFLADESLDDATRNVLWTAKSE